MGNTNATYTTPAYDGLAVVTAVGFKGDIRLYNWATHTSVSPQQYDPGDQGLPIWEYGDSTERIAVYTYSGTGSAMTLTAKISLGQPPPANARANIRVSAGSGGPVVASINNVSITYPLLTIDNIPGNLGAVPNYNGSINSFGNGFYWEISYNNGATWSFIGPSWHDLYFIFRNPYELSPPIAFMDLFDNSYLYLYDQALRVVMAAARGTTTEEQVMISLSAYIYLRSSYNPGLEAARRHPLEYLGLPCICADFTNMLTGLAKSAGISAETTYIWGGDPATGKSNWFLVRNYPRFGLISPSTMRISRPQHRDHSPPGLYIPANPYFQYHAVTRLISLSRYYDAAYNLSNASIDLLRSASYSPSFTCNTSGANSNRVLSSLWFIGGLGFPNSNPPGAAYDGTVIPGSNTCPL